MDQRINWYRTPIDKTLLRNLTKKNDLRGLLQTGGFLLIFLGTATAALVFSLRQMWIPMAASCYIHCLFHGFVGMEAAVHELSHGTPFKTKWLNEFFYRLFSFLTWNNYLHFRVSHMKHHQLTAFNGLDKEVVLAPITLRTIDFISWLTFDFKKFRMIVFPTIAHFFGRADVDYFFWDPLFPKGDPNRRKMCNWDRFVVIGHLILLALFIYLELWVLIPLILFGSFFVTFFAKGSGMQQHLGLNPNVPDWRVSCHTVIFRPLAAFLYWQMNYHIEHHMYAAVPFFNLRKLHSAIADDTPVPLKGFFSGFQRIIAIRNRQRKDPEYNFMPEFPDTAAPPKIS
ncbi:MAG: hypothetical protein HN368_14240 [Spirochaetales bacterium]|jgi:fatty acid desaturase|nr:hypothetical protein [Spirochaetales bacterium]